MYRSKSQKIQLIESIFTKKENFEKYILDVHSDDDRLDIMNILAQRIVDILLKNELNFLYIKNFNNFKFSLITNLLFKEIANEWVYYAQEELFYSKEEALEEIQNKKNVLFLLALVKWYFSKYKKCYTDKIADSFIRLIEIIPNGASDNQIIKTILKSDFVKHKGVSVVHNYEQLYNRIQDAKRRKNDQLSKLQVKISELNLRLDKEEYSKEDQQKIRTIVKKFEYEMEVLEEKELAHFDDAVKRVRDTMSNYMLNIESFSVN